MKIRSSGIALLTAALAGAGMGGSSAVAAVSGQCGTIASIAAPASVVPGSLQDDAKLLLVTEARQKTLAADLPVDFTVAGLYDDVAKLPSAQPKIAAGTSVSSFLIHSDPVGDAGKRLSATLNFTSDILGVMVQGPALFGSDSAVGATGVAYPASDPSNDKRGLELGSNLDWVRLKARSIEVSVRTSTVDDEIRVITAGATDLTTRASGYQMVAADGGIFSFGNAANYGSMGGQKLNKPIVGMASPCTGGGYWLVASDGGIFAFGDAKALGSMGGTKLNQPVVGMASTPTGNGYWLVASDGGIFAFGDAKALGSMGGTKLNQPVVGMLPTPTGNGYWLVASDGGIFAFGDAKALGSMGGTKLNQPVVGMTATPSGNGYWLVASDGGIFGFGDANANDPFYGSTGSLKLNRPIVGMVVSPGGKGYRLVASDGGIFAFGDAANAFYGSMAGSTLNSPIVAAL